MIPNILSKYKLTNFNNIIALDNKDNAKNITIDITNSNSFFIKTNNLNRFINIKLDNNYKDLASDLDFIKLDFFICLDNPTNNRDLNIRFPNNIKIDISPNQIIYIVLFSNNGGNSWQLLYIKIFDIKDFDKNSFKYINISNNDLKLNSDKFEPLSDFISTGDISHDYFISTLDGPPVIKAFRDFTINTGHLVTTTNRCKGLYLYIMGDLTVNGTLSMTARGPNCPGQYIGIDPYNLNIELSDSDLTSKYKHVIHPIGGLGSSNTINPGVNGACGAGGFGYGNLAGGNGTSFSGGAGGGCAVGSNKGTVGSPNGGRGGNGIDAGNGHISGAGAGNPHGSANWLPSFPNSNGTGGLIILVVQGDIIINGIISSNGSPGIEGYRGGYAGVWGGGSGGGSIHIFTEIDLDINKITVTGGKHNGGNGTINIVKL